MRYLLLWIAFCFCHLAPAQDSTRHELRYDAPSLPVTDPLTIKDTVIFSKMNFEDFKVYAKFENKPYFIMFSASWCAPCHRIKEELFINPQIVALANQNYLAYYIDMESFDGVEINSKFFKVSQLPTIIFFDPRGVETDRAIGFFDGYYFFRKLRAHIPPTRWGTDWKGETGE